MSNMPKRSEWTREQKEIMLCAAWVTNSFDNGDMREDLWVCYSEGQKPVSSFSDEQIEKMLDTEFPPDDPDVLAEWGVVLWREYVE